MMDFRPALDLIRPALAEGYAVPSFCVWNAETMVAVLSVASDLRAPVMLMNGPGGVFAVAPADRAGSPAASPGGSTCPPRCTSITASSLDHVRACLAAGYTSVMLDYSARPFAENAAALREVVRLARPRGATVEGEIGHVGKANASATEGVAISTSPNPPRPWLT